MRAYIKYFLNCLYFELEMIKSRLGQEFLTNCEISMRVKDDENAIHACDGSLKTIEFNVMSK